MTPAPAARASGVHQPGAIPHTLSPHTCIDFVNSRFTDHTGTGEVFDRLTSPEWRQWYAERCGIAPGHPVSRAVLRTLIEVRDVLRRLLESRRPPDGATLVLLNDLLSASDQYWELSRHQRATRLGLTWRRADWHAVIAATVASYADLLVNGGIDRVKVCENPGCTWIFVDASRNCSRRWCESAACGNLVKVRAHRARRQRAAGSRRPSTQAAR
jgi:predicted RNA-binding Zn ribbon-like protein